MAMTADPIQNRAFARPLKLALLFSVGGEAAIFVVWGLILFPEGNVFNKFMWTIVYCGLGMGGALGTVVALGILGRLEGWKAVILTTALSGVMLGLLCNILCLRLDQTFHYFGGTGAGLLFIANGLGMSLVGGALLGWLTFTEAGRAFGPEWLK